MATVAPEAGAVVPRSDVNTLTYLANLCPLVISCMRVVWCIPPDKDFEPPDDPEVPKTFAESYESIKKIGSGAFAEVYMVTDKVKGGKFAAKIITTATLDPIQRAEIHYEIEMLRRMKHPNVLSLIDFFQDQEKTHIVTNYCSGGELFDRLMSKEQYTESEARDVVKVLLETVNYIHSEGVVHRDLKPENLLLKSSDDDINIVIADFGCAGEFAHVDAEEPVGTPEYMAPEMIMRKPYNQSVDVWACGCIIYCLLSGTPPFEDSKIVKLMNKIKKGKWGFKSTSWNDVSFEAKDIIKKMLVLDPEKRFTIEQALCHDWMTMDIKRKASIKLTRAQKKMEENFSSKRFKRSVNKIIAINRLSNRLSFGSMDNGSFKDSGRSSFGNGSFKNNPAWANGTFRNGSFVLNKPPSFGEDESGRSGRSIEGSDSLEDSDSMAIVRKRSAGKGKLQKMMSVVQEDTGPGLSKMSLTIESDGSVSEKRSRGSAADCTATDALFEMGLPEEKREEAVDATASPGVRAEVSNACSPDTPAAQGGGEERCGSRLRAEASDTRVAQSSQGPGRPADVGDGAEGGANPSSPSGAPGDVANLPTPARPRLPSGIGQLDSLRSVGSSDSSGLAPIKGPVGLHGSGVSLRGTNAPLPALDRPAA